MDTNNENKEFPDVELNTISEPPQVEALQIELSHTEATHSEPVNSEPTHNQPTPIEVPHTEPPQAEAVYSDPIYNLPREVPQNMYSPGICVNQPYPRPYGNQPMYAKPPRPRGSGLGGFLRAACLVLVCAFFSAAAAYSVMEYRFNRGDFTINRQVVLGGTVNTPRVESGVTAPIVSLIEGMTASDIYDLALTQVVGINTETQRSFPSDFRDIITPVSGSGFIISADGYILTNYHVIELAHASKLTINVVLNDGSTHEAEVVGFDAGSDVAVIKINATGFNPTLIGNSDDIRVGQKVYAVGNPFGDFVYTMTDGIVSALDRVLTVEGKTISAFQFSAAVNSGNSGGPLYNANGEVIGIVTAKFIRGNVEGIGFAIPINDAIEIASELIERGYISGRPLIGVTVQTVYPGHAEYYSWVVGAYVRRVNPNSAAERAGILVGDIITAIADEEVDSLDTLRNALRGYSAGETTTITVWRNGADIVKTITFDEDLFAGLPNRPLTPEPDSPDPFENVP
jgi:serine protease Do